MARQPRVARGAAASPSQPDPKTALILDLLDRVDRAHQTFKVELWIYRAGSIAALLMVIFATVRTIASGSPSPVDLGSFLGAGGLFAVTGDRATHFLRENLKLLRDMIMALLPRVEGNG